MTSACAAEQQHKFHHSHQLIDIPPRKLLSRKTTHEMFQDSPKFASTEETLLQKFNLFNGGGDSDEEDSDIFSSDHFRMYEFKIRRCTRSRSHDWTDCPYAHPGEKARRRDPRRYHYSGTVCADYRRGSCSRGDKCEFAHGVFESWLHPSRYRTEACKDGKNCKRKVCFFAHSPRELRASPEISQVAGERKYRGGNRCCIFCHGVNSSPTSTLLGMSHLSPPLSPSQPLSPPMSPMKHRSLAGFCPISRYNDRFACSDHSSHLRGMSCYKDMLSELMSSLDAINISENSPVSANNANRNFPWVEIPLPQDDQQQFILSPSTPNLSGSRNFLNGDSIPPSNLSVSGIFFNGDSSCTPSSGNYFSRDGSGNSFFTGENKVGVENCGSSSADPDLGWVHDLLK